MNPWLTQEREGRNTIDRYCDFRDRAITAGRGGERSCTQNSAGL
jgi:hypothetical protein